MGGWLEAEVRYVILYADFNVKISIRIKHEDIRSYQYNIFRQDFMEQSGLSVWFCRLYSGAGPVGLSVAELYPLQVQLW
jgi:hypothetical protein